MLKEADGTVENWLDTICPIVAEEDEAAIKAQALEMLLATKNTPKTPPKSPAKIDKFKRKLEESGQDAEDELLGEGGRKKKLKMDDGDGVLESELEAYEKYRKMKSEEVRQADSNATGAMRLRLEPSDGTLSIRFLELVVPLLTATSSYN